MVQIKKAGLLTSSASLILTGCMASAKDYHDEGDKQQPKQDYIDMRDVEREVAEMQPKLIAKAYEEKWEQEAKEQAEKEAKAKAEAEEKEKAAKVEAEEKEKAAQAEEEEEQEQSEQEANDPASMTPVEKAQWENATFADVHERANYLQAHPNHFNNIVSDADNKAYLNALDDRLETSGEMQMEFILNGQ